MANNVFCNSSAIEVIVLGAGQDVGRSCIVCRLGDKSVMFDCGVHMGYSDNRRFPDFKQLGKYYPNAKSYNDAIDCVLISHFHLDHVGALPYFTELVHPTAFSNKIVMTHPTKAICPILLHDWCKIQRHDNNNNNSNSQLISYSSEDVSKCMSKSIGVSVHETYHICDGLRVKSFYAGHVLGAAMFLVQCEGVGSVLYTGDYNMTPDRHLGCAQISGGAAIRPDLMITESTYATMIRESRRIRERNFFRKVHECIAGGGKVLIPVFALGRAQELMILLESYWQRMDLAVPIYFSAGLAQKANDYYKLFINWCNQSIRQDLSEQNRNAFDFEHIESWNHAQHIEVDSPCVLLATSGMLHAGTSLKVFKKWCDDKRNLVVLPGYCVANTVGGQLIAGNKQIEIEGKVYDVHMQIANLSFSAHADMKGIMQLIRQVAPSNVMLVHGEAKKMKSLKHKIECELELKCFTPANGEYLSIETCKYIALKVSRQSIYNNCQLLSGHLVISENHGHGNGNGQNNIEFVESSHESNAVLNETQHQVLFDLFCCLMPKKHLKLRSNHNHNENENASALRWLYDTIQRNLSHEYLVKIKRECVEIRARGRRNHDQVEMKENLINNNQHEEATHGKTKSAERLSYCVRVHVEKLRVRIVYPHHLTELAALVQSLVNLTCDSYC